MLVVGPQMGELVKKTKKKCKFLKKVLAIINAAGIITIVVCSFSSYMIG
jgi:hypothetical protein